MVRFKYAVTGVCCLLFISQALAETETHDTPHHRCMKARRLIEDVNSGKLAFRDAQRQCGSMLKIVHVSGKVFHFAPHIVPPDAPVAGVLVSIAEFPFTRFLNIRTGDEGYWTMPVIKFRNVPLKLSFLFEKEGFVKAKSNVLTITDCDLDSIAMQFPDRTFHDAAVAQLEQQVSGAIGMPYTVQTLAVATVGKSWASLFLNLFPHGDPGATVTVTPPVSFPSLGPIYFNESVAPDPSQPYVSTDGGVLFANLPEGEYTLDAYKTPFTYIPVTFDIEPGISLYIASPPHSLQGTNDSGPGEW